MSDPILMNVGLIFYVILPPRLMGMQSQLYIHRVTFPSSRGSSQPRDPTQVSHIAGGVFTSWATREALNLSKAGK